VDVWSTSVPFIYLLDDSRLRKVGLQISNGDNMAPEKLMGKATYLVQYEPYGNQAYPVEYASGK